MIDFTVVLYFYVFFFFFSLSFRNRFVFEMDGVHCDHFVDILNE